ncbi:unnamed protein product [Amaranthus hypochondriacus]
MTEYWVSQGNKWCDFCKIFLTNNPNTIRNHELGQRHKENVAKRLTDMRKEKAAKEKQEKEAANTLQQIEAKAIRSYQKDVASQESKQSQAPTDSLTGDTAWEYDNTSGYYYDQHTRIHYDPKSGFYYSDVLGKWVTQEEAFAAAKTSAGSTQKVPLKNSLASSASGKSTSKKDDAKITSGRAPGTVVSESLNPTRSVKGAPSSVAVGKRKRPDEKTKAITAEEAAALKAREAAKKRVEEREKSLLGLYGN